MIGSRFVVLTTLLIFSDAKLIAQEGVSNYIIVTIENSFQVSMHGIKNYYWIVPVDSLRSSSNITFYPLFLTGTIKNDLDDCCNGRDIDPYVFKSSDTLKFLDDHQAESITQLSKILSKKQKKVQKNTKEFIASGNKEYITYYATPIKGNFCNCSFSKTGQLRTGYSGRVFVPISSFEFDDDFWQTDKAKFFLNQDFSKINFNVIF